MHPIAFVASPRVAFRLARIHATLLLALVSVLLPAHPGTAAPIVVPTSLLPGQQYRLAFVTAGTRDATSLNIADYDAFVTAEANTEAALSSISWQVIGSTATVSARDHTSTDPMNYPGVPIFLLNDVKLVDDYADLWDGTLDVPLGVDQHGLQALGYVWTGTFPDGSISSVPGGGSFGSRNVMYGGSDHWDSWWISEEFHTAFTIPHLMYALSEVLVVPEASVTAPLTLGFAALLLLRRVPGGLR